jgi:hypothetical protein
VFWKRVGTHFDVAFKNNKITKTKTKDHKRQSILGYEFLRNCCLRTKYCHYSKTATRICVTSLKRKKPAAFTFGNKLVYGTSVRSAIGTGTVWPCGTKYSFQKHNATKIFRLDTYGLYRYPSKCGNILSRIRGNHT